METVEVLDIIEGAFDSPQVTGLLLLSLSLISIGGKVLYKESHPEHWFPYVFVVFGLLGLWLCATGTCKRSIDMGRRCKIERPQKGDNFPPMFREQIKVNGLVKEHAGHSGKQGAGML